MPFIVRNILRRLTVTAICETVCGIISRAEEAWAKRRYEAHFISKLTDCDGENSETDSSLDFARDCGFITIDQHRALVLMSQEIGKMLGSMIKNPGPFLISDR